MPKYDLPKKEQPPISEPEVTQEQLSELMKIISSQRTNEAEVALMRAENAQLKQVLANFTENYRKFESLTMNLIQESTSKQMKLLKEIENKQEQKLNELITSNEEVNKNIDEAVKSIKTEISKDVTSIYEKMDNKVTQSMNKYKASLKVIEEKAKKFWTFNDIKETLFWAMSAAIIIMTANATFDKFGVELDELWAIAYPATFIIPFGAYVIRILIKGKE